MFCLIGAQPRTEWLPPEIERDEKGFVKTGRDVVRLATLDRSWPPAPFAGNEPSRGCSRRETCAAAAVKRVAAAVGDGAMAVECVHDVHDVLGTYA